jgi:sterol desaturase/sphingolipid hydroxylase (fatty acid hydroxylase superfamily)
MIGISSVRLASRIGSLQALLPTVYLLTAILLAEFVGYWWQRLLRRNRSQESGTIHLLAGSETYPPDSALRFREAPLLNPWFRTARRVHDIHHRSVREGSAGTKFGTGIFPFGCVFCTIHKVQLAYNQQTLGAARKRFA